MKQLVMTLLTSLVAAAPVTAQDILKVYRNDRGVSWGMPLSIDNVGEFRFSDANRTLRTSVVRGDESEVSLSLDVQSLDSIVFPTTLDDAGKGHDKYRVFTLNIDTDGRTPLVYKDEWVGCHFSLDGLGQYSDYSGTGRIRGRGNSTWEWYDKKPYKFKLDKKSKLLGLDKAKDWNLLANYRDVTDMMNVFAFEAARVMGLPHTNHTRFVEVFLNGEYIGVYQLTEKIEVDDNRVNIDRQGGVLMSFDADDGPELSPGAGDNFWSKVYRLPMCIKYPENLSDYQIDSIRTEFAKLETAIKTHDYDTAAGLMDMPSFIAILQMHEYLYNVEIDAPRSLYMYRDKDGKYTFGPVWDWDAGYDFDWSDMMTGHTFFTDYRELIYGTDPAKGTGASYNISGFWRDLFNNATFVTQYKQAWTNVSKDIFVTPWTETEAYINAMRECGAYDRDTDRWPLQSYGGGWWNPTLVTFTPEEEIAKMRTWLSRRKDYIDAVISGYPSGNNEVLDPDATVVATIPVNQSVSYRNGYSQSGSINIPQTDVVGLLGGTPSALVPLNADGSDGTNTAAKRYGAWFTSSGDTGPWAQGHVYIESDDLYVWAYGCHPDNCGATDKHTVTMQYRRGNKAVNVEVTFTLQN